MRLTGDWLDADSTQAVLRAASGDAGPALIVGGTVRNAVQGRVVSDLDMATPVLPEVVIEQARAAGLKVIATGIEHGTVTIVADGIAHEVTTFRRDVETTGRHATVAYSIDIAEDAARRDFTMNALYVDAQGVVIDPLNGLDDARTGRVRFIGDARARIREDYLRILRFFRFNATYASGAADAQGLAACGELADGLSQLSAERITVEMCKLLDAATPACSLAEMADAGVLQQVLPMAQVAHMAALQQAEAALAVSPRWQRRLLAVGGDSTGWRMSNADRRQLTIAQRVLGTVGTTAARAQQAGSQIALDVALVEAAILGVLPATDVASECARGAAAQFPLTGADLMPPYRGGRALGAELARLREIWIDQDFQSDRQTLLDMMRQP